MHIETICNNTWVLLWPILYWSKLPTQQRFWRTFFSFYIDQTIFHW